MNGISNGTQIPDILYKQISIHKHESTIKKIDWFWTKI